VEATREPVLAAVPIPVRETVGATGLALELMLREAARVPVVTGVMFTITVQKAVAARVVGQLFVWEKSPGLAPVKEMAPSVSGLTLVLVTTTGWAVEGVPTLLGAKVMELVEREIVA